MMLKLSAAAVAMCCAMAVAGPGAACASKDASACAGQAKTVANEAKGDCPLSCDGAKGAAMTSVSNEAKGDCARACESASLQKVANEPKGECPLQCDGAKGAAVQSVAYAGPEGGACDKSACAEGEKDCAQACNEPCKLECSAPAMTFKVGDETMACGETAKKVAAEHHGAVHYVVNGDEYSDEAEARAAHMAAMERYLDSLTHVSYSVGGEHLECPMSAASACEKTGAKMQYQVGPMVFDSADEAIKAAAMARGALQQVAMSYEVEGKATQCSMEAKTMAESCASKSMTYVVNGHKTECAETAKYMLTEAKVHAAVGAIQKLMS